MPLSPRLAIVFIIPLCIVGQRRIAQTEYGPRLQTQRETATLGILLPNVRDNRQMLSAFKREITRYNSDSSLGFHDYVFLYGSHMVMGKNPPQWKEVCRWIQGGVNAVLYFPGDSEDLQINWSETISKFTTIATPTICYTTSDVVNTQLAFGWSLQLSPSVQQQAEAILDFMVRYNWPSFTLIKVERISDKFQESLTELLKQPAYRDHLTFGEEPLDLQALIYRGNGRHEVISKMLSALKGRDRSRVFVLVSDGKSADMIFKLAAQLGLTGPEYIWIVTRATIDGFQRLNTAPENFPPGVFGITYETIDFSEYASKLIPLAVQMFARSIDRVVSQDGSIASIRQVVSCIGDGGTGIPSTGGHHLYKELKVGPYNIKSLNGNGKTFQASFQEDGFLNFTQLLIYNLAYNKKWNKIGVWNPKNRLRIDGITWPGLKAFPPSGISSHHLRKIGATGNNNNGQRPSKIIRVVSILETPWLKKDKTGYKGYIVDLLDNLKNEMDFDYQITLVDEYGNLDANDSWSGMIESLRLNKSHLAAAPLTITRQRAEAVYFTEPFMEGGIIMLMRKPPRYTWHGISFGLLRPFSNALWVFLVVISFFISIVILIIGKLHPKEKEAMHLDEMTLFLSWWYAWSTLWLQKLPRQLHSCALRCVFLSWYLFAILTAAAYLSNLTVMLLVPNRGRPITPIKEAKDLLAEPEYSYGMISSGTTRTFFRASTDPMHSALWERLTKPDDLVAAVSQGVDKLESHKYALFLETPMAAYYTNQRDCKYQTVGPTLNNIDYGLATNDKQFKEKLDFHIKRLRTTEVLSSLYPKWFGQSTRCPQEVQYHKLVKHKPLELEDFLAVPILLLCCLIGTVFVGVAEIARDGVGFGFSYACRRAEPEEENNTSAARKSMIKSSDRNTNQSQADGLRKRRGTSSTIGNEEPGDGGYTTPKRSQTKDSLSKRLTVEPQHEWMDNVHESIVIEAMEDELDSSVDDKNFPLTDEVSPERLLDIRVRPEQGPSTEL